MDKIYSRRNIRLPKVKMFFANKEGKDFKKISKIMLILTIAILTVISIDNAITPMFNVLCLEKAKGIATEILNLESSKILQDVDYEDLVKIIKDSDDNINMLKINVIEMNLLALDIAYNIQQELNNLDRNTILIPMGTLTGNKYVAGYGPNIKIKIIPVRKCTYRC